MQKEGDYVSGAVKHGTIMVFRALQCIAVSALKSSTQEKKKEN